MTPATQEMLVGFTIAGAFMVFMMLLVAASVVGGVFVSRWLDKTK